MRECSKSIPRRLSDSNFIRRYFVGDGIDIGGKPDPLALYMEFFPLVQTLRTWDWDDGDAQHLSTIKDGTLDFVHSSHCLEHLAQPRAGLSTWFRVLREGGYMIVTVPDEDLYEQGTFPSTFNKDHKWTFTILKSKSWSQKSLNIFDLLASLGDDADIVKVEKLTSTYRYDLPRFDQTLTPVAECGIEFIVRKRTKAEITHAGLKNNRLEQPNREVRIHLNQYKDDMQRMKQSNGLHPPFQNDSEI